MDFLLEKKGHFVLKNLFLSHITQTYCQLCTSMTGVFSPFVIFGYLKCLQPVAPEPHSARYPLHGGSYQTKN